MKQTQFNEFLVELSALFKKYGFDNRAVKVQGQPKVEEQILERKENPSPKYHAGTYGSPAIYEEFKKTKDLKLVWARMSSSVKEYQLDPVEVAKISPDHCPVTGALIDYGYGLNRVTDNPYFRPGIDHIISVGNGGAKYGDITNIQIVSEFFNTIKNYGTMINAIQWLGFELKKLFFGKKAN
jgi:hypothetical protein